jgi:hypothetical protein
MYHLVSYLVYSSILYKVYSLSSSLKLLISILPSILKKKKKKKKNFFFLFPFNKKLSYFFILYSYNYTIHATNYTTIYPTKKNNKAFLIDSLLKP